MQSDRELLEAAAKAAGLPVRWEHWPSTSKGAFYLPNGQSSERHGEGFTQWNPLNDDGDALRLAVKLRINVVPEYVYEGPWLDGGSLRDPYAATRRAIVRAAAALASHDGQEARG